MRVDSMTNEIPISNNSSIVFVNKQTHVLVVCMESRMQFFENLGSFSGMLNLFSNEFKNVNFLNVML